MSGGHTGLLERLQSLAGTSTPDPRGGAPLEAPSPDAGAEARSHARTLRVEVGTLDRILDLTGEIAVARGRLALALEGGGLETARDLHREAERLQADLQELVLKVRMVPLGPTLSRATRALRDATGPGGKRARLRLEGGDVEVDTKVAELIGDPLTHLVRNAVAHGIESPEARGAAGKDPWGTVTVTAARETGSIVITVSDDGAGLVPARILDAARRRGLVAPDEIAPLGPEEIQRLIFEPGFSTAHEVSALSGRGVGLDVVRRNVEALRGTLSVASVPGQGASFAMRLPLSLAIIPAFAVGVADETFLMPLESVVACVELPAGDDGRRDTGFLDLRGELVPFVRLRHRLDVGGAAPRREQVVIVQHRDRAIGLVADRVLGDRQAVVKPLGRLLRDLPGLAGSSVLGDGSVALLLDVAALVDKTAPGPSPAQAV